ncbi:MAG: haloacid dehalogenase-like hydrolase [Butyrivibrio sp.]|nr:haloacid dehalogenase-like hydrolase [Butyrivibrio sp.]
MGKRILNSFASDFEKMGKKELLSAIAESEGRTLMTECIGMFTPQCEDVSNAELCAAFGSDFILCNIFDVWNPDVKGLPEHKAEDTVRLIKKLTGLPLAINLEPGKIIEGSDNPWALTKGRIANAENAVRARDMGVNMILITGNPGIGVTNEGILNAIREIKEAVGDDMIIASGKMHAAGIITEGADAILTMEDIDAFAEAGADIILLPAPGTVPGITVEWARERVSYIHKKGRLSMTAIGTSQEGTDEETIKQIALMCKQTGTDIHHIGDSGHPGIAAPKNIMAYSISIRGIRHTYHRMAASARR